MKRKNSLTKLSKMFESISNEESQNPDKVLEQEGIDSEILVKDGLNKIEFYRKNVEILSDRECLLEKALLKWKDISERFNKGISREIEPLLLNSSNNGLKLFFQSVDDIENQEDLEKDSAKMQLEIALFRLKEDLLKNQSED